MAGPFAICPMPVPSHEICFENGKRKIQAKFKIFELELGCEIAFIFKSDI